MHWVERKVVKRQQHNFYKQKPLNQARGTVITVRYFRTEEEESEKRLSPTHTQTGHLKKTIIFR